MTSSKIPARSSRSASAAVAVYFWLCFRKELLREEHANGGPVVCPEPSSAITDRRAFGASAAVFLLAVVLLVTHAQTGLTVACIGVIVAALTLLVMALSHGKATVLEVIRGVDYKTLLFFIGLFVSVCGLEKTGVLDIIARFITNISGGHVATIVVIILWLSAVTSAFVDNIPFAAHDDPRSSAPSPRSRAWTWACWHGRCPSARTSAATRRHRRERERGRHLGIRQGRLSHRLGALLQILRARHDPRDGGVHGVSVPGATSERRKEYTTMKDQIIITMGREHGSGGHYIADMIARELGIKLYDKDSIESEIVSEATARS